MKEFFRKLKENKVLQLIGKIIYIIIFIVVILMLLVVIVQRTTNNAISICGFRVFTVATGSMTPRYEVGDIVISKEFPIDEIKIGDDIVYKGTKGSFKDKVVTHSVISIQKKEDGTRKIITKGIANVEQDPEIGEEQILGKVVYHVKSLSFISKLMRNIYIFYFCVFVPIVIIIFRQIRNIIAGDKEENEEDKEDDVNDR